MWSLIAENLVLFRRRGDTPAYFSFAGSESIMPADTGINLFYARVTSAGPALERSGERPSVPERLFSASLSTMLEAFSTSRPQCREAGVNLTATTVHGQPRDPPGWGRSPSLWIRGCDVITFERAQHRLIAAAMLSMPPGIGFSARDICMEAAALEESAMGGSLPGADGRVLQPSQVALSQNITGSHHAGVFPQASPLRDAHDACGGLLPEVLSIAHALTECDALLVESSGRQVGFPASAVLFQSVQLREPELL